MDNQFLIESDRHPDGYFCEKDNALDGITLEDVVLALHNESGVLTKEKLNSVVRRILDSRTQDLWNIVHANDKEIIDLAYDGRSDDPNKNNILFDPKWAKESMALCNDIIQWLVKNDCWKDACIYVNGDRILVDGVNNVGVISLKIEKNKDPKDYFEYVREPNILSMAYDGKLYKILNYEDMFALNDVFKKHGLYYEMGNAWNLSAYPI